MNIHGVVRFFAQTGPFSLGVFTLHHMRLYRPYRRETAANSGLGLLAAAFMENPGCECAA